MIDRQRFTGSFLLLPRTRNANPFGSNKAISGPMKLVSGLNYSLGSYSFDEISTMALGQVFQIEKFICWQKSQVKM